MIRLFREQRRELARLVRRKKNECFAQAGQTQVSIQEIDRMLSINKMRKRLASREKKKTTCNR